MKKRKILLWTSALCLIAFTLWAANPSFQVFNSNQFNTASSSSINIASGALLTNIFFGDTATTYPVVIQDTATSHGLIAMKDHTGATIGDFTDLGFTFNTTLQINGLTASALVKTDGSKILASIANGTGYLKSDFTWDNTVVTTATVPNPSWSTNGFSAAATFPTATNGVYSLTNAAGAVTFTAVSGTSVDHITWGTAIIDANGADRTLTLPASWRVPDGTRTITVTNGTIGSLTVFCYAQKYTNAFYRCGY